jgi:spermidine synthase
MLEKEKNSTETLYDLLVIDAFTDDSIPVHLLTLDAFKMYQMRLKSNGVIAVHVSNRYLDLAKPVKRIAREQRLFMVTIQDRNPVFNYSNSSDWILLSSDSEKLNLKLPQNTRFRTEEEIGGSDLWTDDFSSILPIIKF